jgi:DNA-binding GntR family transcriptional regulator
MLARKTLGRTPIAQRAGATGGPLYRQLLQVLKQEIVSGVHPVGAQLPTESALGKRFGVSRHTVREALRQLRADGLVVSRQGAGTTVAKAGAPVRYVHAVGSIEELISYAKETRFDAAATGPVVTDPLLAERLGCGTGEHWLRIEGLRYPQAQGAPICWTEVFVRAEYGGIARVLARRPGPIYAWIEDLYGERIDEIEQVLSARPMPAAAAALLGVEPGSLGVEIRRAYRLTGGKTAEVAFSLHPAERFSYTMTLRRGNA